MGEANALRNALRIERGECTVARRADLVNRANQSELFWVADAGVNRE
jgi:hypothetical protein